MKGANEVIAIMLAMFLVLGVFSSYDYLIEHAHHDCSGEYCAVCVQIKEAVQFLSGIKFVLVRSFMIAVLCAFILGIASVKNHIVIRNTLVTLKVELLN